MSGSDFYPKEYDNNCICKRATEDARPRIRKFVTFYPDAWSSGVRIEVPHGWIVSKEHYNYKEE